MRKVIILMAAVGALGFKASAQMPEKVEINNINISRTEKDSVRVNFDLFIGKATKKNYKLTLFPSIYNDGQSEKLTPVEVKGRKYQVLERRRNMSAGVYSKKRNKSFVTRNKRGLAYSVTVPYQPWMEGSGLVISASREGCCRTTAINPVVVAENLIRKAAATSRTPRPYYDTTAVSYITAEQSVADKLAKQYSFIAPVSELEKTRRNTVSGTLFNLNMPLNMGKGTTTVQQNDVEKFIDDNSGGSLKIYFKVGSAVIDRYFMSNNPTLVKLASAVKAIENSSDSKVVEIVVAGFASPEGSLSLNDRLAWNRALSVKDFVVNNSTVPAEDVNLYNGSENWIGLRKLVENSDIYYKAQILNIINYVPVDNGREKQLMDLAGGEPYNFMLRNFFPELRNAAYIKVYYQDVADSGTSLIREVMNLMEGGKYTEALSLIQQLPESANRQNVEGVCYMMTGNAVQAESLFKKAAAAGNPYAKRNLETMQSGS